jgi:hypothetical protein
MRRSLVVLVVVGALAAGPLAGCSSDDGGSGSPAPAGAAGTTTRPVTQPPGTGACDDVDPSSCLLPWPNDRFTRGDATTATGRRLDLPRDGMPANRDGVHIDPAEWDRNDGFSPASTLITVVPGLDAEASHLPPVTDIGASLAKGSSLVLVDATTGKRVAAWAELDANVEAKAQRPLLIVPAAALTEGHRYAVGLRGLVTTDGAEVRPSTRFAALLAKPDAEAAAVFAALEGSGVQRDELDVAWGFTVGSADSISGRLRAMWKATQDQLDGGAPAFEVTSNEEQGAARVVRGTLTMPKFLTGDGGPGTVLRNDGDPDGIPAASGTMTDEFVCLVPKSATPSKPFETILYGHGLLGSRNEALGIGALGASVNLGFCALDELGMSAADVPAVVASFADLTRFRTLPDRLQQGALGFLLLGRLVRSPDGFATDPAFQDGAGHPVIDTSQASFLGASQGGILGGVASSLTKDWDRVVLAVGGLGYNLLLRRSVDFDEFRPTVEAAYPDERSHALLLDLLEQLWQRGENAGYAQHLARDPFPGVPAKTVLLLEAFGDHQVANVATERLARTLPVGRRVPTLADGRSRDDEPFFGIPALTLPSKGSGLVVWDFGTPAPPVENLPNRAGSDPHGKLADVPQALQLLLGFVGPDARIADVCGAGEPCASPG